MTPLQIGAVSYLNTKPLVHGLDSLANQCEIVYDLPSRLADRLASGELDVALIPSIEAITHPQYTIVSDACIGCRGPVWSVKLLSRVEPEQITSLALDEGSRTSAALTKILLAEKYGITPQLQPLKIDDDWRTVTTDAVLVIGDRAMNLDNQPFAFSWDLGEIWNRWTGLPFVFAMWTAADRQHLDSLDRILTECRDAGLRHLTTIADQNAKQYNLSIEQARRYLGEHLHFTLGAQEKSGLEEYIRLAVKHQLIPEQNQLNFHECQSTQ